MTKEAMLKLRKQAKAKKPNFIREDYQKRACIPKPWRRPRGRHSKMRHRFAGHRDLVSPSYGSPREVRHLDPSGYLPVVVHNVRDLTLLNPKNHGAVLSGRVGEAKIALMLVKAKELGLTVLNYKDIDSELKIIQDKLASRKEAKAKIAKAKESKAKEKEKAAKDKKPELTEKVNEEEQKKQEKAEKDKVLTSKE